MVKIKHSNPGWINKLVNRYGSGAEVLAVGYPVGTSGTSTKYPDGPEVVLVAAVNNFGSASQGIPARPFMTEGFVPAVEATNPIKTRLVPLLNQGKITKAQILEHMGAPAVNAFRNTILRGNWVPNKPETIARKGSSRPLTDTGLMRQTLTYVVRGKA